MTTPKRVAGRTPDAAFLNYANAEKYAQRKQQETDMSDEFDTNRTTWRVETWETADERENKNV